MPSQADYDALLARYMRLLQGIRLLLDGEIRAQLKFAQAASPSGKAGSASPDSDVRLVQPPAPSAQGDSHA